MTDEEVEFEHLLLLSAIDHKRRREQAAARLRERRPEFEAGIAAMRKELGIEPITEN